MKSSCIVILSNSKYSDLWESILFNFQNITGLDKSFDIFISSDFHSDQACISSTYGIQFLLYPDNFSWSAAFKYVVTKYISGNYKYVLFTFEDLYIIKFNSKRVSKILNRNFDYYKLVKTHINLYNYFFCKKGEINLSRNNDSYIGSLVFTIFNVTFLEKSLCNISDDLNPWQYELLCSTLFIDRKNFFCSSQNLVIYKNLVIKGRIDPFAKMHVDKYLKRDSSLSRESMTLFMVVCYYLKIVAWRIFRFMIPFSIHRIVRFRYN